MITRRELDWDGCVNARDLGGLGRIRPGAVIRMEAPTQLTEAGWAAARAYGVRTVIDLRSPDETVPDDTPRPTGLTTVHVPQHPLASPFRRRWSAIDNLASPLYFRAMLTEHPKPVVAAVRAIATAPPGGVVFHCAGGTDRTGLLALVLLVLAGASTKEIVDDYLLGDERVEPRYAALGVGDQVGKVTARLAARGTTVEESLAATIGSLTMPDLLLDNGLPAKDLVFLIDRLTARVPHGLQRTG